MEISVHTSLGIHGRFIRKVTPHFVMISVDTSHPIHTTLSKKWPPLMQSPLRLLRTLTPTTYSKKWPLKIQKFLGLPSHLSPTTYYKKWPLKIQKFPGHASHHSPVLNPKSDPQKCKISLWMPRYLAAVYFHAKNGMHSVKKWKVKSVKMH